MGHYTPEHLCGVAGEERDVIPERDTRGRGVEGRGGGGKGTLKSHHPLCGLLTHHPLVGLSFPGIPTFYRWAVRQRDSPRRTFDSGDYVLLNGV